MATVAVELQQIYRASQPDARAMTAIVKFIPCCSVSNVRFIWLEVVFS